MGDCCFNGISASGNDVSELEGIVDLVKDLEETRCQYAKENVELKQDLQELETEVIELEDLLREEQCRIEENETEIGLLQGAKKSLQKDLKTKEHEAQAHRNIYHELSEAEADKQMLQDALEQCHNQNKIMRNKHAEVNKIEQDLDEKIKMLQETLNVSMRKMNRYQKEVESLTKENECFSKKNEVYEKKLVDLKSNTDRYEEQLASMRASWGQLEEANTKIKETVKRLKAELAREKVKNETVGEEIEMHVNQQNQLKKEVAAVRAEVSSLCEELSRKKAEYAESQKDLKEQVSAFDSHKTAIASLTDGILNGRKTVDCARVKMEMAKTARTVRTTGKRARSCRSGYRSQPRTGHKGVRNGFDLPSSRKCEK